MNGEHLYDLRPAHTGGRRDTNGGWDGLGDPLQDALTDAWAVGMVLAAYDHVLFDSWLMGNGTGEAWQATLGELVAARGRILADAIPLRLRGYRADGELVGAGVEAT